MASTAYELTSLMNESQANAAAGGMASPSIGRPKDGLGAGKLARRLSYGCTDTAGQLIFCVISFYLLKFYTDVYGISAATAGTILLVARCVDAVDAPVWGVIFDRTRSRWGRSRPWFLWLCGPFALFGVLTFMTPHLGYTAKVLYAAATYVACSVLYTGINTPVTSILAALTTDPAERVVLTCYRMFGSKFGVLIVNLTALTLVARLGHGNDRLGFERVMPLYAAVSVGLFLVAFLNLREVVPEEPRPHSALGNFAAVKGNWPWLIIFSSSLLFWIAFIARISAAPYFFQYVLGRPGLIPYANSFDFVSLAAVLILPWLCRRTSKTAAWIAGLLAMALGQIVLAAGTRDHSLTLVLAGWGFGFLASGIAMAMPFSVLADSVDYGEWKTGVRAAGVLTAIGASFCLKAGSGLGGALPAWVMAAHGYVPNAAQSAQSIEGIEWAVIWLPAAGFVLSALPVFFYRRFERMESRIREELAARRATNASSITAAAGP